ncbi:MAG: GWxTD domain-containing protein [Bacteroidota bacterium]
MQRTASYCIILLFIFSIKIFAVPDTLNTDKYKLGIESLVKKDTAAAVHYFNQSIILHNDAPSYFELGKLTFSYKPIADVGDAFDHVYEAVELDPQNIEYRLYLAFLREERYYDNRINFLQRGYAISDYQDILKMDSTCAGAWANLGRLKAEDFWEYQTSESKLDTNKAIDPTERYAHEGNIEAEQFRIEYEYKKQDYGLLSYSGFVMEDFLQAENSLIRAVKFNPVLASANLDLAKLYYSIKNYGFAITVLENAVKLDSTNKDYHLYLGLLYYTVNLITKSEKEFSKAFSLMNKKERDDYTYNSVLMMIEQRFPYKLESLPGEQVRDIIKLFWQIYDPLYITDRNERIVEHYARIVYANMFLGSRKLKIAGWQTNRGEVALRYGIPPHVIRYRDDIKLGPKTEVWEYGDKSFAFTDQFKNNEYEFALEHRSQVPINTFEEIKKLRKEKFQEYHPKFEGPSFNASKSFYQFRSEKNKTDLYVCYSINLQDSMQSDYYYNGGHSAGLFFFDKNYYKIFENKKSFPFEQKKNKIVNTLHSSAVPDSGFISFEVLRNNDNGVHAFKEKFTVKNYSGSTLMLSDIVLADQISPDSNFVNGFERKDISLLPNPANSFGTNNLPYLYYEVYNLKKGENNLTDFEQEITIETAEEKSGFEEFLSSVGSIFGLGGADKITLTSNYKTLETDPQIFLQIDMNEYEPGNYKITLLVKDNLGGTETTRTALFYWER